MKTLHWLFLIILLVFLPSLVFSLKTSEIKTSQSISAPKDGVEFYGDQVLNVYVRPNYRNAGEYTSDYYGSMDANNDGEINQTDLDLIRSGTSNYRTDGNGDGTTNSVDGDLLESFLNGTIPNLPSDWEKLTPNERISWFEKMWQNIDDSQTQVSGEFCGYYATQFQINFSGIENIEESGIDLNRLDASFNGGFNLPVYVISTRTQTIAHFANAIFIGTDNPETDKPTNLDAWYFYDNTWAKRTYPGDFNMDEDSFVEITRYCYANPNGIELGHVKMPIIDFDLENGLVVEITWVNPDLVMERPPENLPPYGQKPIDYTGEFPFDESPDNTGVPSGVGDDSGEQVSVEYTDFETNKTNIGTITDVEYYILRNWVLEDDQSTTTDLGNQRIESEDTSPPEFTTFPDDIQVSTGDTTMAICGQPTCSDNSGLTIQMSCSDAKVDYDNGYNVWERTWTITDVSGNLADSVQTIREQSGVGIKDLPHNKDVNVYPNPASEVLTITISNQLFQTSPQGFEIRITTISGMLIHSIKAESASITIPLSKVVSGTLLVQVFMDGDLVAVQKVIKK